MLKPKGQQQLKRLVWWNYNHTENDIATMEESMVHMLDGCILVQEALGSHEQVNIKKDGDRYRAFVYGLRAGIRYGISASGSTVEDCLMSLCHKIGMFWQADDPFAKKEQEQSLNRFD